MKRFTYIGILLFSFLAGSCIKEDLSECTLKIKVLFSYLGDGTTEIFADKHEMVNLYVYNDANTLVQKRRITKEELNALQGAWLDLLPGNYKIVCWGNAMEKTKVQNCESGAGFGQAQISHFSANAAYEGVQPIDSLYYGSCSVSVPDKGTLIGDSLILSAIPFQGAHIKFCVAVKGLDLAFPTEIPVVRLTMEDMPHCCDFNKEITADICCYHPALTEISEGFMTARFCSMRFSNENNIALKLTRGDNDKVFYSLPLADFLQKEGIDVEGRHEVTVPILIEFTEPFGDNLQVSVIVKKWDEVLLIPDLDS